MLYCRSCQLRFKFLTLNVVIRIVLLHLSNFCPSSVADFSNTGARAPTLAESIAFLPMQRMMRLWVWVMVIFQWLYFNLINRCHPKRWVSVVPLTELFDPGCWPVEFVRLAFDEASCWLIAGFKCFGSHPPCYFQWLLRLNLKKKKKKKKKSFSFLLSSFTSFPSYLYIP